ncbi:MAG: bifunctional glutamate N-acetyltransferase/amino-acid acetyltransferase ArgJ [Verrucomicrobiales bacterium]|nr:bifunctional glutamate N-acetyltransferase/amino-acid acetyltransferase ArgJ [Verrucomicrobiales bacterium]
MKISEITDGVCAPKGFRTAAVSCGIKKKGADRLDLALIYSDHPTVGAAVFTKNEVKAAPVRLSAANIKAREPRAIIANSGNANACTGETGRQNAEAMVAATAQALGLDPEEVQVCSTGIIGLNMPIERIVPRIPELADGLGSNNDDVARAIMTSDTKPKTYAVEYEESDGTKVRIGAIAKGAGMINPNMATMFCFVTTDAAISREKLESATKTAVDQSFNCISVDGDMSTNDTVIVIANGQAGNSDVSDTFQDALNEVMLNLAKKMVSDGERVTKLVTVRVKGAKSRDDAEKAARAVSNSKLVKCSWNGNDPNWGRIIHAVGYSGAQIEESKISISFNDLPACENGLTSPTPLDDLASAVENNQFTVGIDLNLGDGEFTMYTADLSPEYVVFNREEYALTRNRIEG